MSAREEEPISVITLSANNSARRIEPSEEKAFSLSNENTTPEAAITPNNMYTPEQRLKCSERLPRMTLKAVDKSVKMIKNERILRPAKGSSRQTARIPFSGRVKIMYIKTARKKRKAVNHGETA